MIVGRDCREGRSVQVAPRRTSSHHTTQYPHNHTMGVQKKTRKFAQVKRVIGQRDARLKKNQVTGADDKPKKPAEEVVRDMCVFILCLLSSLASLFCAIHTDRKSQQSTSTLLNVLPTQHRPPTTLLSPSRHKLSLPHRPQQTRTASIPNGLPLRNLPPHNNILRNGRTRKTRSKISHRAQDRQR